MTMLIFNLFKKNKISLIIIIAIIVAVGAWYFFFRLPIEPIEVISDDGSATLIIPAGALPSGVSADDIVITSVSNTGDALAVYDMSPDGISFNKPVRLSIILPAGSVTDGQAPFLVNFGSEQAQFAANNEVGVDDDGRVRLSGEVDHFSTAVAISGLFGASMDDDLGTYEVGETFSVTAKIQRLKNGFSWYSELDGNTWIGKVSSFPSVRPENPDPRNFPYVILGEFTHFEGILSPHYIPQPPLNTRVQQSLSPVAEFTCERPGMAVVNFKIGLLFTLDMASSEHNFKVQKGQDAHPVSYLVRLKGVARCVASSAEKKSEPQIEPIPTAPTPIPEPIPELVPEPTPVSQCDKEAFYACFGDGDITPCMSQCPLVLVDCPPGMSGGCYDAEPSCGDACTKEFNDGCFVASGCSNADF